jgi:hypothetical protein
MTDLVDHNTARATYKDPWDIFARDLAGSIKA